VFLSDTRHAQVLAFPGIANISFAFVFDEFWCVYFLPCASTAILNMDRVPMQGVLSVGAH